MIFGCLIAGVALMKASSSFLSALMITSFCSLVNPNASTCSFSVIFSAFALNSSISPSNLGNSGSCSEVIFPFLIPISADRNACFLISLICGPCRSLSSLATAFSMPSLNILLKLSFSHLSVDLRMPIALSYVCFSVSSSSSPDVFQAV